MKITQEDKERVLAAIDNTVGGKASRNYLAFATGMERDHLNRVMNAVAGSLEITNSRRYGACWQRMPKIEAPDEIR